MENAFAGIRFTKSYVIVGWKGSVGAAVRFQEVKVPWKSIVADEALMDALGHHLAAYLKSQWAMDNEDYPLF